MCLPRLVRVLLPLSVLLFSYQVFSAVPIVDAGISVNNQATSAQESEQSAPAQAALFNQLQQLQQEMMQLRGLVEEQGHRIDQLQKQTAERYTDLDNCITALTPASSTPVTAPDDTSSTSTLPLAEATPSVKIPPASNQQSSDEQLAYDKAYNLVVNKQFNSALAAFKQFLVTYPDNQYTPNALYWSGELYQVIDPKDLEQAKQMFNGLLERYPTNAKAPDAMYSLGKIYFQQGDLATSTMWFDRLTNAYPANNPAVEKAHQYMQAHFNNQVNDA
jgi:tol-pal system protein YbgF